MPLLRGVPTGRTIDVHFRIFEHTDATAAVQEPIVAFEGGPGYSTIDSSDYYRFMLGPLLATHDLILMDQRGTGASDAIACPDLQHEIGTYVDAVAACAHQLGEAANAYGSAAVADDLASILDALGVLARRRVRGLLRELPRAGLRAASPEPHASRRAGRHLRRLVRSARTRRRRVAAARLGDALRSRRHLPGHPRSDLALRTTARDATAGRRRRGCRRQPGAGAAHAGVARTTPVRRHLHVRDLRRLPGRPPGVRPGDDAPMLRASRRRPGDDAPMLRLAAEDLGSTSPGNDVTAYSEGDAAAVSCHDYPVVWDRAAPFAEREHQLDQVLDGLPATAFAPFSNDAWLDSVYEYELVNGLSAVAGAAAGRRHDGADEAAPSRPAGPRAERRVRRHDPAVGRASGGEGVAELDVRRGRERGPRDGARRLRGMRVGDRAAVRPHPRCREHVVRLPHASDPRGGRLPPLGGRGAAGPAGADGAMRRSPSTVRWRGSPAKPSATRSPAGGA